MGQLRHYQIQLLALALVCGVLFVPYIAFAAAEANFVQRLVWGVVLAVTGLMVGLGGAILDAGINLFVIRFGDFFLTSGIGVAVNNTWVIIRDFMNLMFIFGLVYIGFKMILGSDTSNTRRWLVNLILAALLINFSLFITKFVIDFSNQMTTEIAVAAFNTETATNGDGTPTRKVTMSKDLQVRMGITSLLSLGDNGLPGERNAWGYIFGTGIFFLVTAFVYAAGGILLMIRFAVLNLYMVMSPLLFISWILPPLSSSTGKHWKGFFSKCFFAPVYLLFIYFSLKILDGFQTALPGLGGGQMVDLVSGGKDGATTAAAAQSTLPFFILICIFMIASLVIAQRMGAEGASQAVSLGRNLSNRAQRFAKRSAGAATVGVGAGVLRNTAGRVANTYANSDIGKRRATNGVLGKFAYKAAQYGAGASYDPRQVGGLGKTLDIGEGKKGGYSKNLKDKATAEKKFLSDIGTVDIDSEEGKRKVAAKEKELSEKAKNEKELASGVQAEFENNLNISTDTFERSIKTLSGTIDTLEKELEKDTAAGILTDNDRAEKQKEIAAKKNELNQKETVRGAITNAISMREGREKADSNLAAYIYSGGSDKVEETRLRNEAEKAKAAYETQITTQKAEYENQTETATKAIANAPDRAKATVKYQRQIDHMAQLQKSEDFWKGGNVIRASGIGAAGAVGLAGIPLSALAVAGIGSGYGAASAIGASAKSAEKKYVRSEIEKEYGIDGLKKMKKDKRVEQKKIDKEAEKDLEDDADKKGDKDDDKK